MPKFWPRWHWVSNQPNPSLSKHLKPAKLVTPYLKQKQNMWQINRFHSILFYAIALAKFRKRPNMKNPEINTKVGLPILYFCLAICSVSNFKRGSSSWVYLIWLCFKIKDPQNPPSFLLKWSIYNHQIHQTSLLHVPGKFEISVFFETQHMDVRNFLTNSWIIEIQNLPCSLNICVFFLQNCYPQFHPACKILHQKKCFQLLNWVRGAARSRSAKPASTGGTLSLWSSPAERWCRFQRLKFPKENTHLQQVRVLNHTVANHWKTWYSMMTYTRIVLVSNHSKVIRHHILTS